MAKWVPDNILDLPLNAIAQAGNKLYICNAQPTLYSQLVTVGKGNSTLTTGISGGSYTIGNGDVSGRKITVAATWMTPTSTATITHVAIANSVGATLTAITICNFTVVEAVPFTVNSFDLLEIRDPA